MIHQSLVKNLYMLPVVVLLLVLLRGVVPCGHGENGPMEDWVMVPYQDLIIVVVELLMLVKQKEQQEQVQV